MGNPRAHPGKQHWWQRHHLQLPYLPLVAVLACVICLAAGCGDRDDDRLPGEPRSTDQAALPAPTDTARSVIEPSGRPRDEQDLRAPQLGDAPQSVGTPSSPNPLPDSASNDAGAGSALDPDNPDPLNTASAADADTNEPTAADAVIVLRDYYAAINARDYPRAHRLWADNGAASGQTAVQFADGFSQTQGVSIDVKAPDDQEAGAGQRYLRVPVSLTAIHRDGSVHRFAGSYVLHRSVVDGATPEQRSWRIQSANLREVQ